MKEKVRAKIRNKTRVYASALKTKTSLDRLKSWAISYFRQL
jgi:hypothetical protein